MPRVCHDSSLKVMAYKSGAKYAKLLTVKSVAARAGKHMVDPVTSPTQVLILLNVESVTRTGVVPAQTLKLVSVDSYDSRLV